MNFGIHSIGNGRDKGKDPNSCNDFAGPGQAGHGVGVEGMTNGQVSVKAKSKNQLPSIEGRAIRKNTDLSMEKATMVRTDE